MARLNRSSLPFMGLVVSLGTASMIGCGFDTHGIPPDDTTSGTSSGMGGAGGTGGGGMAGAGGAMVCKPGVKEPCYSGAPNTPNIGICKAGTKTCLADGTGYGACVGEVVPGIENCITVGDEDCDGLKDLEDSECKCTTPGMKAPCETGLLGICRVGVGICSADGLSVDDCIQSNMSTPENCATADDDDCNGTAAAACTGEPTWVYAPLGSAATPNDDAIYAVAFTPDGGSVIAGVIKGTINADGFALANGGGSIYVTKLNAAGEMQWSNQYPCTTFGAARGVATDAAGNIIVVGEFEGTTQFDGTNNVSSANNASDIFMLKLNPTGNGIWHKVIGVNNHQVAADVAVDTNGDIFITGYAVNDAFSFGGNTFDPDNVDTFIAKFDSNGNHKWSTLHVNTGAQRGRRLVLTTAGDVVVIGDTSGSVDLGGGMRAGGGNQDFFVAKYASADGAHAWSKLYGKAGDQSGQGIGLAADGNILIAGTFETAIDWKMGTTMTAIGTSDVYVAQLDAMTGDHLAHTQGGKTGVSVGTSIGADASGNVTVFGHFNGSIDFGGQAITSTTGSYDTFLIKLKVGDWKPVWTKPFGKTGNQFGWDVAVANDGSALVGGGYITELDVPPLQKISGGTDMNLYAIHVDP